MRAYHFWASTTAQSRAKLWHQYNVFMPLPATSGLGVCFAVGYFMYILVLQSS